jgi:hypothetical protein
MHKTLRRSVVAAGLTATLAAGLGTVLAAPSGASTVQPLALSCQQRIVTELSTGHVTLFGVRCKGNSYWAEGWCAGVGSVKGRTEFPPFLLPNYGPWSNIGCPSGSYLTSYHKNN